MNEEKVPDVNAGKKYLRIHEQALFLGVHPKTIGRLARNDPSFPLEISLSDGVNGVRVRSLVELEAWVLARKQKGARS